MLAKAVSPARPCPYVEVMRRFALALIAVLALPAAAAARGRTTTNAPPGNSGVSQYVETIPTAHGGQPTSTVHRGGAGSGHSGAGGGGTGTSGGSPGGGSSVSSSTQRGLDSEGSAGRTAAAFILATAPSGTRSSTQTHASGATNGSTANGSSVAPGEESGASPASSVFHALTGSTSSGGLGSLLPVILIASLLAISTAAVVLRRRRTT